MVVVVVCGLGDVLLVYGGMKFWLIGMYYVYIVLKLFILLVGLYGVYSVMFFVFKGFLCLKGMLGYFILYDFNMFICVGVVCGY